VVFLVHVSPPNLPSQPYLQVGSDISVSIATHYGLESPGFKFRWGRDFPHPSRPTLGPTQAPTQWSQSLFPEGVKRPGLRLMHPPPFIAEVKERAELNLYSFSGLSWPVLGRTFFTHTCNMPIQLIFLDFITRIY
jgi:hypothetical protein